MNDWIDKNCGVYGKEYNRSLYDDLKKYYQQVIKGRQTGNYPKNTYPKGRPSMQEQCARFRYYIKNLQHYDAFSDGGYDKIIKN